MKPLLLVCICLFSYMHCLGQNIIFKGRIKCNNQNENSTKGAENVVIVPTFKPSASTITISQPTGYFEFNSGVPLSTLQDKTVSLYAVSRCSICKETTQRVFVSEDQDRQYRQDNRLYVTIKDWLLSANCKTAELKPGAADSVLHMVVKQPDLDLDHVSNTSALVGAPTVINYLARLAEVVTTAYFQNGTYPLSSLDSGKIKYGQSFFASSLVHTANAGFNFAPTRDLSEAVFWNASAMPLSKHRIDINFMTNLRNSLKLNAYYKPIDKFAIGLGFLGTRQFESRVAHFAGIDRGAGKADTVFLKNIEWGLYLSAGYTLNHRLNIGLTTKGLNQRFNTPDSLIFTHGGTNEYIYKTLHFLKLDVDLSATYRLNNALQIGVSLMNIGGAAFKKDVYSTDGTGNLPAVAARSLGLGITYKKERIHAGINLLLANGLLYDIAMGLNYVPFNNVLVSINTAIKSKAYSIAFRLKHFRLAFIDDGGWLIDDRVAKKSNFLKGRISGGFTYGIN